MKSAIWAAALACTLATAGPSARAADLYYPPGPILPPRVVLVPWPTTVPNDPLYAPRSTITAQPLDVFYNMPASGLGLPLPGIRLVPLPRVPRAPLQGVYPG